MNALKLFLIQIIRRKESLLFIVLFIAGLSLVGWLSGLMGLATISAKYIPIAPSSALMFIVLCILYITNTKFENLRLIQSIKILVGVIAVLFCLEIFLDYLFNFIWDIENIFIRNPENLGYVPIGRMSPITSILFILITVNIFSIGQKHSNIVRYIGGSFSLLTIIASSVLLIGYLYKAPLLYGGKTIPVSLLSAICFFLFSVTLLRELDYRFWTLNLIGNNPITKKLLKAFLPLVVFIVILQGFLITSFSHNLKNPTLPVALILLIVIAITFYIIIRISTHLGDNLERVERELLLAKENAEESDRLNSTLLQTIPFGMDIVDQNGNILFLSHNLEQHFGDKPLFNKCWELYRDDKIQCSGCPLNSEIILGETKVYESHSVLGGKIFDVVHTGMVYKGQKAMLEIFIDISERKKSEQIIQEQNKELQKLNTDKDRFISILAHDLKSPFNSILGYLELLTENIRVYDTAKIEKQIGIINTSAQNTYNLMEDILMWAKSQSGNIPFTPSLVLCTSICKDILPVMQQIANAKKITINYSIANEVSVFADIGMLKTILRNLISNAIKFTNISGRIDIRAEQSDSGLTISISDNGVGIQPETLSHIFEITKKVSTKGTGNETGTGLGLSLCKEFVEKHDGKIWVESEVNKGSTFYFTLPERNQNELSL